MRVCDVTGPVLKPLAYMLEKNDMSMLGLGATMRLAKRYNRLSFGREHRNRQRLYQEKFTELARENGEMSNPPIQMQDGWAIDRSQSLPYLQQLLKDSSEIISERGETKQADYFGKPFLVNILKTQDFDRYPSILDFATSSQMLATVSQECGFIPMLGTSMPPGVRLMESTTKFDPTPDGPWRSSQLWHLDYHSSPTIYVIVALRDITPDMGPIIFMSRSDSQKVGTALNYRSKGAKYRVSDEAMNEVLGDCKLHEFTGPAGSVLMIDSNQCFHFGSRKPAMPRYHMQYAYLCACRTDFGDISRKQVAFKTSDSDSRLRRLVLERTFSC